MAPAGRSSNEYSVIDDHMKPVARGGRRPGSLESLRPFGEGRVVGDVESEPGELEGGAQ